MSAEIIVAAKAWLKARQAAADNAREGRPEGWTELGTAEADLAQAVREYERSQAG